MSNRFWKWLATRLPRKLAFWVAVRVTCDGIQEDGTILCSNEQLERKLKKWWHYSLERHVWSHKSIEKKKPAGRFWLHLWERCIHFEWSLKGKHCDFYLTLNGDEREITFHLGIPFIGGFWLGFEHFLPRWLYPYKWTKSNRSGEMWKMPIERKIGMSVHHGKVWLSLWENPMEGGRDDPWWWEFSWSPVDTLLGRRKYSRQELLTTAATVSLPERDYPVNVAIFESTWKRPRWPWPTKLIRADIDSIEKGIPAHAGKGENSWDMEDDAVFSMTTIADTPEEAVKKMADSILRDRRRYGPPTELLRERAEAERRT